MIGDINATVFCQHINYRNVFNFITAVELIVYNMILRIVLHRKKSKLRWQ